MVVHAGAGIHDGTLVNALLHRFTTLSSLGGELRPASCIRLDRFTHRLSCSLQSTTQRTAIWRRSLLRDKCRKITSRWWKAVSKGKAGSISRLRAIHAIVRA